MPTEYTDHQKALEEKINAFETQVKDLHQRDDNEIVRTLVMHRRWLIGKGGFRLNLEFRDLSGADLHGAMLDSAMLTGANLAKVNLRGASLKQAILVGADLEEADLRDADLTGADLRGANFHRALLAGATLHGADLSCLGIEATDRRTEIEGKPTILTEANLSQAILCQAKLIGCDLSGAELHDADLSGADMTDSILLGADLSGANLANSVLHNAVLDLSSQDPATMAKIAAIGGTVAPTYRELSVGGFVDAIRDHEQWVDSGGASGRRLDLDRARIPAVKMTGRNLAGARCRRSLVEGGEWIEVNLRMADFSFSNIAGITIRAGDLRGIALRRSNLTAGNLTGSNLDVHPVGGRTWPSNLEGAILREANLTNATFGNAILRRVDFTGCTVSGTSMRGADLEGAKRP
ncbi:MAG: pentapeptide repeat-containing protein [Azospirillaceae bacterium]|nr:pentapeptide repeat-containing protein [Azospirillaceae bacterium]